MSEATDSQSSYDEESLSSLKKLSSEIGDLRLRLMVKQLIGQLEVSYDRKIDILQKMDLNSDDILQSLESQNVLEGLPSMDKAERLLTFSQDIRFHSLTEQKLYLRFIFDLIQLIAGKKPESKPLSPKPSYELLNKRVPDELPDIEPIITKATSVVKVPVVEELNVKQEFTSTIENYVRARERNDLSTMDACRRKIRLLPSMKGKKPYNIMFEKVTGDKL